MDKRLLIALASGLLEFPDINFGSYEIAIMFPNCYKSTQP
tara:strand:+ start:216 stop:335 length:120 start_codon:yes stop_codon:yes gene_type:complete